MQREPILGLYADANGSLALLEMKLLLRDTYSAYRTRVAPDMTASMELDDLTLSSRPKGMKCLVVFEKFDDE